MRFGIVGSEGAKFTPTTERAAKDLIHDLCMSPDVTAVISGGCHLGGIDRWAAEEGKALGLEVVEHLPKRLQWEGGYKQRNLLIAKDADSTVCITLRELPKDWKGMAFTQCYHCCTTQHVKSGGCWTVKQARKLGKTGHVYVIEPNGSVCHES